MHANVHMQRRIGLEIETGTYLMTGIRTYDVSDDGRL